MRAWRTCWPVALACLAAAAAAADSAVPESWRHPVGAKQEFEELKRKLRGQKADEAPPPGASADTAQAAGGAPAVCLANTDVVAQVTNEPCDQIHTKSRNRRIWTSTSWRGGAMAVIEVISITKDGKEDRYVGTDVVPPGRHFSGVCGVRAVVKSCRLGQ